MVAKRRPTGNSHSDSGRRGTSEEQAKASKCYGIGPAAFRIDYPSGQAFRLSGRLMLNAPGPIQLKLFSVISIQLDQPQGPPGGERFDAGTIIALDPRALVRIDSSDEIVYNPRHYVGNMSEILREWMNSHPDWPARAMTGGQS